MGIGKWYSSQVIVSRVTGDPCPCKFRWTRARRSTWTGFTNVIVLGYALLVIAALYYLFRVRTAFTSAGGTIDVVTRDAVLFAPISASLGLFLVLRAYEIHWSFWAYAGVWFGLAAIFWGTILLAQELGDREL